ncbi:Bacteroides conjugative transposon TraN protein [Hydrobacter penzbergensis]|uniref:Bacteroides conjugative transposon TraN protein n=1 Tax=Hydrobacter penzbergensis TaxID=1235997 RepID=A0A8X8IDH0_9BACT|nr:conjugative transposon protein TraN [Hydrobacter penzbergensis]SDW13572.1 Bacteroides conjugative transposon TraN protein [Hydrobacter penzbergensis]
MKKISARVVTGILLLLLSVRLFAQNNAETKVTVIKPYVLPITFYKTTNLIFPYAIKSVDRGSKDILVQKAKGVENILQVKAGKPGFDQTNLTVITADGKLYSYILNYSDTLSVLNIRFDNTTAVYPEALFPNISINEAQVKADADTVAMTKETIHGVKDKSYGMKMKVSGLYIKGDVLFLRLTLQNQTNINYDIDQLRFYIRDEKKAKRTATQELEISPLYIKGDTLVIARQTEKVFVYALPKFTIPDKKYLAIELMEKSGGRHLRIHVHNKTIIRAKLLQ